MLRLLHESTLFPYTTLFRSNRLQAALWREVIHLVNEDVVSVADADAAIAYGPGLRWALMGPSLIFHLAGGEGRSEEHTSELQSHVNLVCRLLLEKKNNQSTH